MTDLPDLIREAHRRGLKVNNLFELQEGGWRANVRNGACYDFCDAETPELALRGAIDKACSIEPPNFLD